MFLNNGYWRLYGRDGMEYLHRGCYEAYHGEIPKGCHIHHIDGNKLNNNIENLVLMDGGKHTVLHNKLPPLPNNVIIQVEWIDGRTLQLISD